MRHVDRAALRPAGSSEIYPASAPTPNLEYSRFVSNLNAKPGTRVGYFHRKCNPSESADTKPCNDHPRFQGVLHCWDSGCLKSIVFHGIKQITHKEPKKIQVDSPMGHRYNSTCSLEHHAPLAQLVEQLTLNQWVPGSNP